MSYFIVKAKCGHVGRNNSIIISYAVKAIDAKNAAKKTRNFPRVKHHCKYAILSVEKVNYKRFKHQYKDNNNDPYLKCRNVQDQTNVYSLIQHRIITEIDAVEDDIKNNRFERLILLRKKRKNIQRYANNYCY